MKQETEVSLMRLFSVIPRRSVCTCDIPDVSAKAERFARSNNDFNFALRNFVAGFRRANSTIPYRTCTLRVLSYLLRSRNSEKENDNRRETCGTTDTFPLVSTLHIRRIHGLEEQCGPD